MHKNFIKALLLGSTLTLGLYATASMAQGRFDDVEIKTEQLRDNVYVLFGAGGNIGVSAGADGVFVIDDQFAELSERIVAAIREFSDEPIRFLVNTHWHGDHSGGNENFATDHDTLIFAHDNVRVRLEQGLDRGDGRVTPPAPEAALPVVTFSETNTFHLNGEAVRAIHIEHAHTDGDAIVHFTGSNVIHMGDTFFNGFYPFIDIQSGGNVSGVIKAADTALALAGSETKIIPGHGPVSNIDDLRAYRDMLVDVRDKVAGMVKQGKSLDDIKAAGVSAAYDEKWGGGFINPERFVTAIYESLHTAH